jgi:thioredoxin-dependent peroxiredoxin
MATTLKVGDKAPAFKSKDQDGNSFSLADYKGKNVVIYFYPGDDTPVCTVQSCNLRDNFAMLKKEGLHVIGISPDGVTSHKKFTTKYDLPFTLVADESKEILNKYGVWGEKNMYGNKVIGVHRTTFIINEKGIIVKIFLKPKNKAHAEEIIKAWQALKS